MGVTPLLPLFSFIFGCILCTTAPTRADTISGVFHRTALGHWMSPGQENCPSPTRQAGKAQLVEIISAGLQKGRPEETIKGIPAAPPGSPLRMVSMNPCGNTGMRLPCSHTNGRSTTVKSHHSQNLLFLPHHSLISHLVKSQGCSFCTWCYNFCISVDWLYSNYIKFPYSGCSGCRRHSGLL